MFNLTTIIQFHIHCPQNSWRIECSLQISIGRDRIQHVHPML